MFIERMARVMEEVSTKNQIIDACSGQRHLQRKSLCVILMPIPRTERSCWPNLNLRKCSLQLAILVWNEHGKQILFFQTEGGTNHAFTATTRLKLNSVLNLVNIKLYFSKINVNKWQIKKLTIWNSSEVSSESLGRNLNKIYFKE